MEHSRLAVRGAKDERLPKSRLKGARKLPGSPKAKPLKVAVLVIPRGVDKQRERIVLQGQSTVRMVSMSAATTTPDAVAVTLTARGDASLARWTSFIALDLANPRVRQQG